jgi:oligopeptide/dipeptide ABC transporter ATP-binding protein
MMALVSFKNVSKTYRRGDGSTLHAVSDVSLTINPGETVGLIGESGAGKSTIGRLALRLQDVDSGTITFGDKNLGKLSGKELRALRAEMTVVFQEPYQSLNPQMRVGDIVAEPLVIHARELSRQERLGRVANALDHVSLGTRFMDRYPRELSGGQQQRVGIARAIVTHPKFVVLDEPTSSLDLSVRAQVLQLLADLQQELQLAYLFISHDIQSIRHLSARLAVMYLGQIVETGSATSVFDNPRHPYTQALLSAALSANPDERPARFLLRGEIPSPTNLPRGCFLHGRCPIGSDKCSAAPVPLRTVAPQHEVSCIKALPDDQWPDTISGAMPAEVKQAQERQ